MSSTESPSSLSTSPSLLIRACEGDSLSWQKIIQLYGPLVYTWARRTGLAPEDAADVTQDTFSALSTRLTSFDADRPGATFRGWLWTITRNKAADHARKRHPHEIAEGGSTNRERLDALATSDCGAATDTSSPDEQHDRNEVVRRALAIMRGHFEETTWRAFWRSTIDGCSPDDVAEELGISRWSVYKARSRVLQRLRTELSGLEELP